MRGIFILISGLGLLYLFVLRVDAGMPASFTNEIFEKPVAVYRAVFDPASTAAKLPPAKQVTIRTKRIYVREYSDFRPPNGAPIYYSPYPNTLCMLGEGPKHEVRIIHEAKPGACETLIRDSDGHLVRPIKNRSGGDHLRIRTR